MLCYERVFIQVDHTGHVKDLPQLSFIRGQFEISTKDLMLDQVSSRLHGVYFERFGKVILVSESSEMLYLKGTRLQQNATTEHLLNATNERDLLQLGTDHTLALPSAFRSVPSEVARKSSSYEVAPTNEPTKVELTLGLTTPTNDQNSFVVPIITEDYFLRPPKITSSCVFVLNLKAGPSCSPSESSNDCDPEHSPNFALSLEGELVSKNCNASYDLFASV